MYIKNSGSWKQVNEIYIKVSGAWKKVTEGYIKVSGAWKRFWSGGTLAPQSPVEITKSTDGTTYLTTLTGKNYFWSPGPPALNYYFEWSTTGGAPWTQLATNTAVNPAYGSSTSYTYQIPTNRFAGNVTNTYRFRVYATYGATLSGESTAVTTIPGPTDITLTAGGVGPKSIPINWTASTNAGRYLVEYKVNTSSTWLTYSWVGTTFETLYGLADNTTYNVRVTPYTSFSNDSTYKGYAGNASNTVTATTPILPGNITSPELYNFSSGNAQLFFTTGTNTTSVQYSFVSDNVPNYTIGPFTQLTSSSLPYKVEHNLLSYFTLKTWNYDDYSGITYYSGSLVWYAGNRYQAKLQSFSGITPPNTTYWNVSQVFGTVWNVGTSYSVNQKVWYNGDIWNCNIANSGKTPGTIYYDPLGQPIYYWTFDQSLPNTYSSGTSYSLNGTNFGTSSSADYQGTRYTAKDPGFSGVTPPNTTYWSIYQTVTYSPGDYVLFNSTYYFTKYSTNGTYPSNAAYWASTGATFTAYLTPYNSTYNGNQTNTSIGGLLIRGDNSASTPLRISSGPTFSNITSSGFRSTFIPSVYTNQSYFYIQKVVGSTYPTGYNPKILTVTGASSNIHDTDVALSPSTQYSVYITARYVYNAIYGTSHTGETSTPASVTTLTDLPNPPTGLNVSDVGTNRPYGNAAYNLSWTAPTSGTVTGYKIQFQVPSTGTTWYNYSSNTTDTSSTSFTAVGFGSNLSTNFRVYSVNSGGQSTTAVATTSAVLGTTVPQAPTIGTATSFNTYISVTYTANATGGKAINSYTATSSPGSLIGSTSSGSIIVYNVVHNTAYTFTVTATNANGTSASSSASNTAYGVNIGAVSNITSSSTSSSVTLFFTKGTNSTSTRGYINGNYDGTTTGSSYLFSLPTPGTSYNLTLEPYTTVNGTTYYGPQTVGPYSTTVSPPSNTSIPTLSPTSILIGTTLTAGVGSWTNSPTSYDIRIYRGTAGVLMSETLVASTSGSGISLTYTVTQADYDSGQRYFRTYVNASNAGGSSGFVAGQERGPITIPAPVNTVAPSVTPSSGTAGTTQFSSTAGSWSNSPTSYSYQWRYLDQGTAYLAISGATSSTYTPPANYVSLYGSSLRCYVTATNAGGSATANSNTVTVSAGGTAPATPTGVALSVSGVVSWTASSGATSYEIEFYTAQSSAGLSAAGPYTVTGISSSPYQLGSTGSTQYASPNNYARVRVRARNSAGASAYSAWVPSATTYT